MNRRTFMRIVAGSALGSGRPSGGERSAARRALLEKVVRVANGQRSRRLPKGADTPDILAISGVDRRKCEHFYYGKAVFGKVAQLDTERKLEHAVDALREGLKAKPEFLVELKRILESVVGRSGLREWPFLAFGTPMTLSFLMNPGRFSLWRKYRLKGEPWRLPVRRSTTIGLGPPRSAVRLELPKGDVMRLPGRKSPECEPTLIEYGSETMLTVNWGRYDAEIADAVGLLGWEAPDPNRPIRRDSYQSVVIPGDGSVEAAAKCIITPPHMGPSDSLKLEGDIVVDFYPSVDVWLIDPAAQPNGAVDGYLIKASCSRDGELTGLFGCQREMNHILARATLTEALLEFFVSG